jgi:hypothetical protein
MGFGLLQFGFWEMKCSVQRGVFWLYGLCCFVFMDFSQMSCSVEYFVKDLGFYFVMDLLKIPDPPD